LLNRTLDRVVTRPEGRDEERAMDAIRDALRALAEHAATAGFEQPLDWMAVRAFLTEQLQGSTPQQRFLAGGVSVCGLVPLRNVPFKVICVLGLDADSFPRRDPADALNRVLADRLKGKRKPGDRSVREDDRYLFLQTLMAASDCLYLSYTGIDMRRGSVIEPSVVLSEVLDHVCEGYFSDPGAAREALVTQHPMQPFSARLFAPDTQDEDRAHDSNVFTYRHEWLPAAESKPRTQATPAFVDTDWPPPEDAGAVELAALQHFLRNPAQAFLSRQAGLALSSDASVTDMREPLVLDNLQKHQLDAALAGYATRSADALAAAFAPLRAQALLPPLVWGQATFDSALDTLSPGLQRWRDWRGQHAALPARRFRLDLGQGRVLEGVLDDLHEGGYSAWVGKANSPGGWLRWWLGALVITALDGPTDCVAWGRDKDKADWSLPWKPRMPAQSEARSCLGDLLEVYREGQRAPLPLPPRTAFAWAGKHVLEKAEKADKAAQKAAESAWLENDRKSYVESSDAWLALAFRGRKLLDGDELQARFEDLATRVYMPLCQALADGDAP
jgi:exodeoxyribonuclease V gamma subunit